MILNKKFDLPCKKVPLEKGWAIIHPEHDSQKIKDFTSKVNKINAFSSNSCKVLHDQRNLLYRYEYGNLNLAVKEFKLHRKYDKLRFRFLHSKAIRSFKMAIYLKKIYKYPHPYRSS